MPELPSGTARRNVLIAAAGLAGAACTAAVFGAERAQAQRKMAKSEARYQDHPNGPQHCARCAFYVPPVACQLVRGEVTPNGWCGLFRPKAA